MNYSYRELHTWILTNQVQNFEAVDEIVYFSHETFHENDLRQTNAHHSKFCGEGVEVVEIVELHRRTEVKQHVSEIWTFVAQFVEDRMSDKLDRQFDVSQRCR